MDQYEWTPDEWNTEPMKPQTDIKAEKRQIGRIALAVAAVPVLSLIGEILISVIVAIFAPDLFEVEWFTMIAGSACMYLFAMPVAWSIFRSCSVSRPEAESLGAVPTISLFPICISLTLAGSIIGGIVNNVITAVTGKDMTNPVEDMTGNAPIWATVLCVAILAPIMEELFFRKLVIDRLRRYGDLPAILISGVLFGLIHGNFSQFFYAAFLGCVFGFVYCRTGKLRYSVALHMFINFFGGVYSTLMLKALGEMPEDMMDVAYLTEHLGGVLMAIGMFAVYGFAILFCVPAIFGLRQKFRLRKGEVQLTAAERKETVLKNPLIWVLVVVLILRFAEFFIG